MSCECVKSDTRVDNERLRAFLAETLALWRVEGCVEAGDPPLVAVIRQNAGSVVWVERAAQGTPFRWLTRWRRASEAPGRWREMHPRASASVTGLLNALRAALGVERGSAVRVAAAPLEPAPSRNPSLIPEPSAAEGGKWDETAVRLQALIPVSVITGFLGSGKTTLLARVLRDPAMNRTAVIMNELGEIGLDHDLIETSDESFVQLSNGCLCCKVRSDLLLTLADLALRREQQTVPAFERVVIETTGLADPAPILHALLTDRNVRERYLLDNVITTMDALTGLATLDRHRESVRQAAVADRIVLTKTDVDDACAPALCERLTGMNPGAEILVSAQGEATASTLFKGAGHRLEATGRVHAWLEADAWRGTEAEPRHRADIRSFCIVRDEPLHGATLALFLSALGENYGADLLRMKGIVGISEQPGRPAVIHGVQHVYHAPVWLDRWPSEDRRTRMVFIGSNLRESWVRTLLDLIEDEVADETARRSTGKE